MQKYYKEKAIIAIENKIFEIKKNSNLIQKNLWKVVLFGIGFSFYAPTHFHYNYIGSSNTALDYASKSGLTYIQYVFYIAIAYVLFCFLLHYVWKYQDSKELQKLIERKEMLENEIKDLK